MREARHVTKSRWSELSPLLDELLDLEGPALERRLSAIRAEDASLADDLQELLSRQQGMEEANFLASPATVGIVLAAGQAVGAYTLERELGRGGMGTVWLARRTDGRYEGQVAIKFLTLGLLGYGDSGRFAREGQILGRLAHPNIARLVDAGVADPGRQPYLVLEYVDGQPITLYCTRHELDTARRVQLFLDVLAAVAHAHNRLILHRDLKPSNILVTEAGEVKLLDFGIAKLLGDATAPERPTELTLQAGRVYTEQYAAPEQLQGGDVTTATDVYALGVLLYLLLSELHPTAGALLAGQTPLDRMKAVIEHEPRRLSDAVSEDDPRRARELRGDLDTIVARALKKAPAERYGNAAALAEDLQHWLAHEPINARPDTALYVAGKFVRRHRTGVAVGSAVILALALLTTLSVSEAWRADRAEKLALQRSGQADDLLSYMLGEFADKLRPIGKLDLLDSIGSKALSHLAAEDSATLGANARLQQAKALTVVGEVRVSKRDLDGATEPLMAARKLLEGDPPAPGMTGAWRKAQGAAAFWVGHIAFAQRRFAPARAAWEDYRRYCEQWLAAAPGQVEPIVELSYAQNNLGTVMQDTGELPAAVRQFQGSIELKRQALLLQPKDSALQIELANSMSWLGSSLLWEGEFAQARDAFAAGTDLASIARKSVDKDWEWYYREAVMRTWLGEAFQALGQAAQAGSELNSASQLLHEILLQEPANQRWSYQLVRVEADQAQLAAELGGRPSKLEDLAQRLDTLNKAASATAVMGRLPMRSKIALLQAGSLQRTGHGEAAKALLAPLVGTLTEAVARRPEDLKLHLASAQAMLGLARVEAPAGAAGAADEARRQCSAARDQLVGVRFLLRVHYEITKAWVDVHDCLGQGEVTGTERAWLAQKTAPQQ